MLEGGDCDWTITNAGAAHACHRHVIAYPYAALLERGLDCSNIYIYYYWTHHLFLIKRLPVDRNFTLEVET